MVGVDGDGGISSAVVNFTGLCLFVCLLGGGGVGGGGGGGAEELSW